MPGKELSDWISEYIVSFPARWASGRERFKWSAPKNFQDNWDPASKDFRGMLEKAIPNTPFVANRNFLPRVMLLDFAKYEPQKVCEMMETLFDEKLLLQERLAAFKTEAKGLLSRHFKPGLNDYQSAAIKLFWLYLRYPEESGIYSLKDYKSLASAVGVPTVSYHASEDEKACAYVELIRRVAEILRADPRMEELRKSYIVGNQDLIDDKEFHAFASDFASFLTTSLSKKSSVSAEETAEAEGDGPGVRYFWINVDPGEWNWRKREAGETEEFLVQGKDGKRRKDVSAFSNAKPGDLFLGYEASPIQEVVASGHVQRGSDGTSILLCIDDIFEEGVPRKEFNQIPGLERFPVHATIKEIAKESYDAVIRLARPARPASSYVIDDLIKESYLSSKKLDDVQNLWKRKKNLVLQGPPGTGKSYLAKRLAWALLGEKDEERLLSVQFHPGYSYEDFIEGYRPAEGGGFRVEPGVFLQFANKAKNDLGRKYVIFIDEMNRANLPKVLGETLNLLEPDKRGEGNAISLAYSGKPFFLPENLFVIATMNTADRSIAFVDYALRRRFAFVDMAPAFDEQGFQEYMKPLGEKFFSLIDEICKVNKAILMDPSLGKDYLIGHSFFSNWTKEEAGQRIHEVLEHEIRPLLEEYFYDRPDKVSELLDPISQKMR